MDIGRFLKILGLGHVDTNLPINLKDLKKAWRDKCREHHPDAGGDEKEFLKVMHAYKMLTDSAYANSNNHDAIDKVNLQVVIRHVITFEDAHMGGSASVILNVVTIDKKNNPMKTVSDLEEIETLIFEIKPGTMSGDKIVLPGQGAKCGKSGDRGDAQILFHVQEHPKFRIEERDGVRVSVSKEEIPLAVMLQGDEFEVITPAGVRTMKLEPGSQPGHMVPVKDCGPGLKVPHFVEIQPAYPSKEELKNKTWNGLDIDWGPDHVDEFEDEMNYQMQLILQAKGIDPRNLKGEL